LRKKRDKWKKKETKRQKERYIKNLARDSARVSVREKEWERVGV
jgi:hypothetical protein